MTESSIFINGAGLAGTACAIRLRQLGRHAVTLIDQSHFPRGKLCGEFLGPDAMPLLKKLGLLDTVMRHSMDPVLAVHLYNTSGKALHVKLDWLRTDYPFALAIPRAILDTLLIRHAEALGAMTHEETEIQQYEHNSKTDQFTLTLQSIHPKQTTRHEVNAGILIDASGRNSKLQRLLKADTSPCDSQKNFSPAPKIEPYVGVQCHVKLNCSSNDLNMYFFPGGYGGLQPISNEDATVCLWVTPELARLSRQDTPFFLEKSLGQNVAAQTHIKHAHFFEPWKTVGGIHTLHKERSASQSVISVGDALLALEPFSGFGMSHALHTGILAAECIDQGLRAGEAYQQILHNYLNCYHQQFDKQLQWLRWLRPFLSQPFLQKVSWPLLPPFMPTLARLYR